ncbi:DgyrCDS405 [Dimorphilus gyrociliatus]|uniref:DgyrCDS405 n=2 Tax=Dimorphilus gyrociliatus TaxID=2664684 RepID=A0A7I8V788_9ANNE|nr:DgyrCDS405 [Dimorphilus gyrociliatus]
MTMNVQHVLIPSSDFETRRNPTFSRLIFRCSFWSKYCVFVINFFVWVGGVCLMSAGAWAQLEKSRYDTFNSFTNDPALILLLIGVIMFIMSAFGCVGSLRENICLLKTFCLMTAAVFVGELTAGSFTISLSNRLEEELVEDLYNAIQLYGAEKKFTDDIDYVQKRFECCGAKSYDDWQLNKLYNCSANFPSRCGVPTSCCKLDNSPTCGYQTRINGVSIKNRKKSRDSFKIALCYKQ